MLYLYLVLRNKSQKKGMLRKQWSAHCTVMTPKRKWEKNIYVSQILPYLTARVIHSYIFKLEDIITDPLILPHN